MAQLTPRVTPSLLAVDMGVTLAFYERLGFHVTGCAGDRTSARWAEVTRDAVVLQFYRDPPDGTPAHPTCSGTFYFHPTSVAGLAAEFAARGVAFAWGPEVMDYGMLEFGLQDPNGYFLAFTEPVPSPASGGPA